MTSPHHYDKNQPSSICEMFGSIASDYDKANAILSWQMHKLWNKQLIKSVVEPVKPKQYLDLCCGTGDIAFMYLKRIQQSDDLPEKIYLLDFCPEMLIYAKQKAHALNLSQHPLEYINADAQIIPLPDASVDCVTIAYGIRNVKDPAKCIREVRRILRPGGAFGILELTRPENFFLRFCHQLYLKTVLPIMGKWVTANKEAYDYLCKSINVFIPSADLQKMLENEGFCDVSRSKLMGGVATIVAGRNQ